MNLSDIIPEVVQASVHKKMLKDEENEVLFKEILADYNKIKLSEHTIEANSDKILARGYESLVRAFDYHRLVLKVEKIEDGDQTYYQATSLSGYEVTCPIVFYISIDFEKLYNLGDFEPMDSDYKLESADRSNIKTLYTIRRDILIGQHLETFSQAMNAQLQITPDIVTLQERYRTAEENIRKQQIPLPRTY